jgi:hypothetical protein
MYRYLIFLVLLLTGCASVIKPNVIDNKLVYITDGVPFRLSMPPATWQNRFLLQHLQTQVNGEKKQLLFNVEMQADGISMVGLSTSGLELFSLVMSETQDRIQVSQLPLIELEPKYVLADFQLAFWPVELLRKELPSLTIEVEKSEGSLVRVFSLKQLKLITITYSPNEKYVDDKYGYNLFFEHHIRNYQLSITTLEQGEI